MYFFSAWLPPVLALLRFGFLFVNELNCISHLSVLFCCLLRREVWLAFLFQSSNSSKVANDGELFQATKNTALSTERIRPRSIARIGWSTNSSEKFHHESEITVYEGYWGNFYPGRFELWLIPDSGGPEQKLVDRIFRIEGWMRWNLNERTRKETSAKAL